MPTTYSADSKPITNILIVIPPLKKLNTKKIETQSSNNKKISSDIISLSNKKFKNTTKPIPIRVSIHNYLEINSEENMTNQRIDMTWTKKISWNINPRWRKESLEFEVEEFKIIFVIGSYKNQREGQLGE